MAMHARVWRGVVIFVLALVLVAASTATPNQAALFMITNTEQLTPEGARYSVVTADSRIWISNYGAGSNNRELYWDDNSPAMSSATQCVTWTNGVDIAQNGIAFRIESQSGGYNAVVFARNIFIRNYWLFAPKMFHTGSDYTEPWDSPTYIDLGGYLGRSSEAATYPLRVCASLDDDDVLRFAVAKGSDTMPPLTDPGDQGGCWRLDMSRYYHPGQGLTGRNGIFAGHVPIGTSMIIDNVVVTNGA